MNTIKRFLTYGLYLLVFFLTWQARWIIRPGELNQGYWEYGTISLYGTDILLLALIFLNLLVWFFQTRSSLFLPNSLFKRNISQKNKHNRTTALVGKGRSIFFSPITAVALFEIIIILSIFFAADKWLAIYKNCWFLIGAGLFWLLATVDYKKTTLIISFLSGICLQGVLGIWQFFTQASVANKWLGMSVHQAAELGTSVIETAGGERWLRAYGAMDHPNILGGVVAIGLMLTLRLLLEQPVNIKNKPRFFLHVTYTIQLLALLFTFSRGAWAGYVAGILVLLVLVIRKKGSLINRKLVPILIINLIVVVFAVILLGDILTTRLSSETRLEVKSTEERLESYSSASESIKNNWLLGVGIGNYTLAKYQVDANKLPSYEYQPVHNALVLVLAEIGVIGLALVVLYTLLVIKKLHSSRIIYPAMLFMAMVTLLIVDHWIWSLHFGQLFLFFVVGLIYKEIKTTELWITI